MIYNTMFLQNSMTCYLVWNIKKKLVCFFVCVYTIEANGLQSCVAPNAPLYFKKERIE